MANKKEAVKDTETKKKTSSKTTTTKSTPIIYIKMQKKMEEVHNYCQHPRQK